MRKYLTRRPEPVKVGTYFVKQVKMSDLITYLEVERDGRLGPSLAVG